MKEEIWKDIEGYDGLYQVSSYGRVRSLDRITNYANGEKHLWKGRILKPAKNRDGYLTCVLYKNGKTENKNLHRLVAQAFILNPDNLPQVNHKDENPSNNHVENLEWCTQAYNNCYGTRLKKLSMSVLQIDINTGRVISDYPSTMEAERQLNISNSNISACCNGKRKTAGGFKWCYK